MEEAYKLALKSGRVYVSRVLNLSADTKPVMWARWCLPSFNPKCDQDRKGYLADADNSSCDTLICAYREKAAQTEAQSSPATQCIHMRT